MPARGLKKHMPDFTWENNAVSPDEIDRYEQYVIDNPSSDGGWFGTAVGTSTQAKAIGIVNKIADYPRNAVLTVSCASGSTKGGTAVINGKDFFGNSVTETLAVAVAANGGTTVGTQPFAEFVSGTFTFGTSNAGNGTCEIGVGTAGTTTLFQLPTKISSTNDVKLLTRTVDGVAASVNGGTIGGYVNTTYDAILLPADLQAGTQSLSVVFKPSYDNQNGGNPIANW